MGNIERVIIILICQLFKDYFFNIDNVFMYSLEKIYRK